MWKQASKYHLTNGEFTICKVYIAGVCNYELWRGVKFMQTNTDVNILKKFTK